MASLTAIVLAAGTGTRMKSDLPKVLFPVLGRPMIHWVIDALHRAGVERVIAVVGYRADLVRESLEDRGFVEFVLQEQQLGTGHAVQVCREALQSGVGPVLVVAGDSPLLQSDSITDLHRAFSEGGYSCLLGTLVKDNPAGLGRIVRNAQGSFEKIVEQKDATPEQSAIREVNMSTYLFDREGLLEALAHLKNDNAQSEYYLTDCPAWLLQQGRRVEAVSVLRDCEALSINTVDELGLVEAKMKEMGYACGN
jgi:bifunctional UDP-N-acetylglucosamine pyrophosphorylase/glucosamine-1-phosphate N-acetyltransferase/UDP-N-acetylglucosamine pyrophosphorylase